MRIFNIMVNSIYGFYVEVIEVTRRMLSKNEKFFSFESGYSICYTWKQKYGLW